MSSTTRDQPIEPASPSASLSDPGPIDPDERLTELVAGQGIVYGGDRIARVDDELAAAFRPGDQLVVVQDTGALLHVPEVEHRLVADAVTRAVDAFAALRRCGDDAITAFYDAFAELLGDDLAFAPIAAANDADVAAATDAGRTTTRLVLSPSMRSAMIAGLRSWRDAPADRDRIERTVEHVGWRVAARRAPLGTIGFVFEGRPNVFADATGVVRTGNTVVFRIGSDALRTAEAIVEHALRPALERAGLPEGTVTLVPSRSRAAGWALFSDRRLALAVARGSGSAVAQLGAVARQAGIPVSLHGTGGAWLVADERADRERFELAVEHSLDRKVCNTLNVCCVVRAVAADLVPAVIAAAERAAARRDSGARVHVTASAWEHVPPDARTRRVRAVRAEGTFDEPLVSELAVDQLGHEWEWEGSPELSLVVVDDVDEAVELCNRYSPRFVASLISDDTTAHERFFAAVDAPFVGDGFTRWVDGQYALDTPELGLSNWEGGRMLARGAILSGDSAHTIRYRAEIDDPDLHR